MEPEGSKGPLHPFSKCPSEGETTKSYCGACQGQPLFEPSTEQSIKQRLPLPLVKPSKAE